MMTGDVTQDVFVLQPQHDVHARGAMLHYATLVQYQNPGLAAYLRAWVARLHHVNALQRAASGAPAIPDWIREQTANQGKQLPAPDVVGIPDVVNNSTET